MSIKKYLKDKKKVIEYKTFAVRVPLEAAKEMEAIVEKKGWTCSDILRAGVFQFLEEQKKESRNE